MDTTIIVSVMMGSVVAIALIFAKAVLGVAWTEKNVGKFRVTRNSSHTDIIQENLGVTTGCKKAVSLYSVNRKSPARKEPKTNKVDFTNKRVYTCNNIIIGNIDSVANGMIIITSSLSKDIKYEIPVYYIRQNFQSHVVMDISSKDMERYNQQLLVTGQN